MFQKLAKKVSQTSPENRGNPTYRNINITHSCKNANGNKGFPEFFPEGSVILSGIAPVLNFLHTANRCKNGAAA
jgi:hypothetical protein